MWGMSDSYSFHLEFMSIIHGERKISNIQMLSPLMSEQKILKIIHYSNSLWKKIKIILMEKEHVKSSWESILTHWRCKHFKNNFNNVGKGAVSMNPLFSWWSWNLSTMAIVEIIVRLDQKWEVKLSDLSQPLVRMESICVTWHPKTHPY